MSDAQPHTLLSSSPAPTDVSPPSAHLLARPPAEVTTLPPVPKTLVLVPQATATEDAAESLSPDDGELEGEESVCFFFPVLN